MTRSRKMLLLGLLATTLAVATAYFPGGRAQDAGIAPRETRPNLVLVTIDTLRADHLASYGYFRTTSPFLDALAAESIVFERCYATIPHTTPSHASLLTGVLPFEHGITANSFRAPAAMQRSRALVTTPQLQTYAQIVQKEGWATGGFVTAATTAKVTGLAAGFDAWSEPADEKRAGGEALADAKKWLATVGSDRPFFLWLHLFDVHGPHKRGEPWEKYADAFPEDAALLARLGEHHIKAVIDGRNGSQAKPPVFNCRYDASIRFTDDLLGELVAELKTRGAWERTTFVVTGDHGEGLGEHDFLGHEVTWSEQLRVPLIVRVPGHASERLPQVVSLVDVLPTAIDLTPGLPREALFAQATGASVVAEAFLERPVFSMAAAEKELALTGLRWKFVRRVEGGDALYDLQGDPLELHDAKEEQPKIAAALASQLEISVAAQEQRRNWFKAGGVEPTLSADQEAKLKEALLKLGYAVGG